jgi:DNA transposition AAA+ family ATPase
MSNTTVPISEWCKEIRVALAKKETNLQNVAKKIGYSYTTVTALISGRVVKNNYLEIANKINEVLEVNVLPEKPQLPSDEWCGAVRAKLYVKKMNINELSRSIGVNRDKVSLVLNGHALDWAVIEKINEKLKIEVPAVPVGTD